MIQKSFVEQNGELKAQVTFALPNSIWADKIYLVGDFNNWNQKSHPMQQTRKGEWHLTVELDIGKAYQFRYLRDRDHWLNEAKADAYITTSQGNGNFVVMTDTKFS